MAAVVPPANNHTKNTEHSQLAFAAVIRPRAAHQVRTKPWDSLEIDFEFVDIVFSSNCGATKI